MGNRPATATARPGRGEDSEEGSEEGSGLASLAQARYLLLTTFKRSGTPVSAPVHAVVDGGRAYFRAWRRSGTVRRLRGTGGTAQVAPCGVLGLCSYGPPRAATVRPLAGREAAPVARKLAGKYPVQQRLLVSPLQRACRWPMMHFELQVREAAGHQDGLAHRRARGPVTAAHPPRRQPRAQPRRSARGLASGPPVSWRRAASARLAARRAAATSSAGTARDGWPKMARSWAGSTLGVRSA
jgi:PPOX class probable F420-dependent enzyme